ncbi:MAG: 50S ribosomal protein L19 [Patescibacteria group bacterium]|nr:50S ribosomal protein L19 [Patescibacteria group bacterium]MDE2144832.1 50S ribosomal protein L19 [Patescibacteria group bacterium]
MIKQEVLNKIKPGADVKVFEVVKEKDRERTSIFRGRVLARKHGSEPGATFTVRATVAGVGVEKIYPIYSPAINKVEVLSSPKKVHRSKLYYLRSLSAKKAKRKFDAISS